MVKHPPPGRLVAETQQWDDWELFELEKTEDKVRMFVLVLAVLLCFGVQSFLLLLLLLLLLAASLRSFLDSSSFLSWIFGSYFEASLVMIAIYIYRGCWIIASI